MKKLFLNLMIMGLIPFFISCENDELNVKNETTDIKSETTNVVFGSCLNIDKSKSIAIWSYPLSGHAMRCEVWSRPYGNLGHIELKSRTTHYEWKNGSWKTKNASAVYAEIYGRNSPIYYGIIQVHSNNNNNWYLATTAWIFISPSPKGEYCYTGYSTHKIKINGVWYQTTLNLNNYW